MAGMQDEMSSDDEHYYEAYRLPLPRTVMEKLHCAISKMKKVSLGDDDTDILSPIDSPVGNGNGNRGKFFELKQKLEEDQANKTNTTFDVFSPEGCDDLVSMNSALTDSWILHPEIENDQWRMSSWTMQLENHPKFTEMYRQIKERDHKILDLEARLNVLERQANDMQDSITQREKSITLKNEALTMVHKKYGKELEQKEAELRKTQQTMFDLEKNLSGIQDCYSQEKEQLTSAVESQRNKIELLERNNESLENAHAKEKQLLEQRIEKLLEDHKQLDSKVYRLEEDVWRIQAERDELAGHLLENELLLQEKEGKIAELTASAATLETNLRRLKIQFQLKLKALKEKQSAPTSEQKISSNQSDPQSPMQSNKEKDDHQISILQTEISQERETRMTLESKLSSCEANLAERNNELESVKWDYQSLQEDCDVLNQEIRRLKSL